MWEFRVSAKQQHVNQVGASAIKCCYAVFEC